MSLFADFQTTPTWTVAELTSYIRDLFEIDYRLQDIKVTGEISNFTRARSGHLYFTLKDSAAQLRCVMWRNAAERMLLTPQDGDAVIAEGRVSVYEPGGAYQLYVEKVTPSGRGDLALAFEQLKARLDAEGLFAAEFKKPIPAYPERIGIVTSSGAAALRDILNVLGRRYPLAEILIAPTLVQGGEAPARIVQALRWIDGRDDVDVIIIARGGGSMEDLWAFNDERVVRAVFEAGHPVISGIGHETDFTLTDFAADLRAPTPSAAAELAVPEAADLLARLNQHRVFMAAHLTGMVESWRQRVDQDQRTLNLIGPQRRLDSARQRLDSQMLRLERHWGQLMSEWQSQVSLQSARLDSLSPDATLGRGYAIVWTDDGRVVTKAAQVRSEDRLRVQVADGAFDVRVDE